MAIQNPGAQLPQCALLVSSCDAYSDLWRPFFTLMERYWPDLPFPVYLGTGRLSFASEDGRINTLYSEGGRDWSRCMIDYLSAMSEEYVLVMLDDFFLRRRVDMEMIRKCIDYASRNDAIQIRLIPRPEPTHRIKGEHLIGECEVGSPYRLCTQAALWNRRTLLALLKPGESIWEFERKGNLRAENYKTGFYSVWEPVLPYKWRFAHHVVEKGKWLPHEKIVFGKLNIGCDFSKRGTLGLKETTIYHLAQGLDWVLGNLPWRQRVFVKNKLRAALQPFMRESIRRLGEK